MPQNNQKLILIADDDQDDRMMLGDAFAENENPPALIFVEDGEELMNYLHRRGRFSESEKYPLPQLILLDLNMPRKDGRETLKEIKSTPGLKRIPVIIFSTSSETQDIIKCYDEGSNCFLTKPLTFNALVELTRSFSKYWIETAELPPTNPE